MLLGAVFLGIKMGEWYQDYREELVPGINFNWRHAQEKEGKGRSEPPGPRPQAGISPTRETAEPQVDPGGAEVPASVKAGRAQMFFVLYFFMTGLHAFHMIVGLVLVGIMAWLSHRRWFSGGGETQIEMMGLYWHFVDVVWVFLYPLLYLIEVRR